MEMEHLKNLIAAEKADNMDILQRLENALTWNDLDAELREIYDADIPYRRRVVEHLDYLLGCCERWPVPAPEIHNSAMLRDLEDGLEWPEEILDKNLSACVDFICRCSRRWRLNIDAGTGLKSFESVDELMVDLDAPLPPTPDIDAFKTALDKANARFHTSLKKLSEAADDDNSDIS